MNIFRINNKYVAVAIFLMLAVTLQAQDYGALQYMLQKRPANEKFESNKFNEHLFFSAAGSDAGHYRRNGKRKNDAHQPFDALLRYKFRLDTNRGTGYSYL